MNILVIKQTSLGDVLHSTAHVRAIKQHFPACHLTVLTAAESADIYRNNPRVDELIVWHRDTYKRGAWRTSPTQAVRHFADVLRQVRARRYDLAFDLQGLGRSVVFLYAARAARKYVKGRWVGLRGFRQPELHALAEMDGVLACADIPTVTGGDGADDRHGDGGRMEMFTDDATRQTVDELLTKMNPQHRPLLIISPFTRWASKDWQLENYAQVAAQLASDTVAGGTVIAFTGAANARAKIDAALLNVRAVNLAGKLSIPQFAELVRRADLMLSGDSFPMHVACAQQTPVVALFAPTFETRTGPVGAQHQVIRAPNCTPCDRAKCPRRCLDNLPVVTVLDTVTKMLTTKK